MSNNNDDDDRRPPPEAVTEAEAIRRMLALAKGDDPNGQASPVAEP